MIPTILAAATLLIAVPLNWYVTARLWRLYRVSHNPVIRERAIAALGLAIVVTVFGLIFVNNDLVPPVVPFDETKFLTRGALLVVGIVPPLVWEWLYR